MNENLKRLAGNVHEWPCENHQTIKRNGENSFAVYTRGFVTHSQWQAARDELTAQKHWRGPEDGLPPVGLICEYSDCGQYVTTKILAHHPDGADAVWHSCIGGSFSDGCTDSVDSAHYFRPIRTEEDKAVEEMLEIYHTNDSISVRDALRDIYRAGFHKQDKPK